MSPVRANILVPGEFSVPVVLYHSYPLKIIRGTFANVSTLFRTEGLPQRTLHSRKGRTGPGFAAFALD